MKIRGMRWIMFYGYDYDMDRTMLRIGAMNMMIEQYEGQYRSAMYAAVKAHREHHPTGLFPTSRSDTYE